MEAGQLQKDSSCFQALRSCTLRITFVVVIGFGLCVSGLVVCYEVYGQKILTGSQGDVALKSVSTSYCQEVKIASKSNGTYFSAYIVRGNPPMSSKSVVYVNAKTFFMPSWSYQYWTLYLLKGSHVDIYICANQYLMFYVIMGMKSFKEWKQTTLYQDYDQVHRLFPKENCKNRDSFNHYTIQVKNSDYYHLLLSSSVGWRFYTKVSLAVHFDRTVYNTTSAIQSCVDVGFNSTCSLSLEYNSKDSIVIVHGGTKGNIPDMFQTSKLYWHPVPRLQYYAKFFGGIFTAILFFTLFYTVYRFIVKKLDKSKKKQKKMTSRELILGADRRSSSKLYLPRRPRRTTLASYEVVGQTEEELEDERNMSRLNEEFNASNTYSTTEQVRDMSMTAAGISAI
eukprot:gene16350-7745_t